MVPIRGCIFDLDGVLVDTAVYHYKAWKRLANTLGFDFTEQQNESLKGISRAESMKLVLAWGGLTLSAAVREELMAKKNQWYVAMISNMTPAEILPGITTLLEDIREKGIRIALGSASKNAALILLHTGLDRFFDVMVDGQLITASKPDPAVFLKGAELLGELPDRCLVFEDAAAGVEAARAAGMKVIGVGDQQVLAAADLVVKDFSATRFHHIIHFYQQHCC